MRIHQPHKALSALLIASVTFGCTFFKGLTSDDAVSNANVQTDLPPARPKRKAESAPMQPTRGFVSSLLIVGSGPIYAVPLSTAGAPDAVPQVVLELSLVKGSADPTAILNADRKATGEGVYSLEVETFPWSELLALEGAPRRTSFRATLYRGQAGRRGVPLLSKITAKVIRRITPEARSPSHGLAYTLVGDDQQLFAIHTPKDSSDFLQVIAVRIDKGILSDDMATLVRRGSTATIPSLEDSRQSALAPNSKGLAEITLLGKQHPVQLTALKIEFLSTLE